MALCQVKKNKVWIIKAIDRGTEKTIAWVLRNRDTKTFKRLYDKVKPLTKATFYTHNWDIFDKVLPQKTHIIGKKYTSAIERDNSNTRHNLARFTRRTKVVSQKIEMIDTTLKFWQALTNEYFFHIFQDIVLTIFR